MTPAAVVLKVFGSVAAVARIAGVDVAEVARWQTRKGGTIPHDHIRPLLAAAARRRKALSLAELCFGRPVPEAFESGRPVERIDALGMMARDLAKPQ